MSRRLLRMSSCQHFCHQTSSTWPRPGERRLLLLRMYDPGEQGRLFGQVAANKTCRVFRYLKHSFSVVDALVTCSLGLQQRKCSWWDREQRQLLLSSQFLTRSANTARLIKHIILITRAALCPRPPWLEAAIRAVHHRGSPHVHCCSKPPSAWRQKERKLLLDRTTARLICIR